MRRGKHVPYNLAASAACLFGVICLVLDLSGWLPASANQFSWLGITGLIACIFALLLGLYASPSLNRYPEEPPPSPDSPTEAYIPKLEEKLRFAQDQLVKLEKMSHLGQLTAGIAHEINNPVNFVSANIDSLRTDIGEILHLLEKYELAHGHAHPEEILAQAHQFGEQVNKDLLIQEIEGLLSGIEEGARRTQTIVKGLKSYSRKESLAFSEVDLHKILDTSLLILHNKLKKKATLHKNYQAHPFIEAQAGRLEQVFLNILDNAVQAIPTEGQIYLDTGNDPDARSVWISIRDTGAGMNDNVKKHIFEPFFTTKETAEGTGLGLSISHEIIRAHHGTIQVESRPQMGTTFLIRLPIRQQT